MSGPANDDSPRVGLLFEVVGDDGQIVGGLKVDGAGAFQWVFDDDVSEAARLTAIADVLKKQILAVPDDRLLVISATIIRTLRTMTNDVPHRRLALDVIRHDVLTWLGE